MENFRVTAKHINPGLHKLLKYTEFLDHLRDDKKLTQERVNALVLDAKEKGKYMKRFNYDPNAFLEVGSIKALSVFDKDEYASLEQKIEEEKATKRARRTDESPPRATVQTENPFNLLAEESMDASTIPNASNSPKTIHIPAASNSLKNSQIPASTNNMMPPIYVRVNSGVDWRELHSAIKAATKSIPRASFSGDKLKLVFSSTEEHICCKNFLASKKMEFHYLSSKEDKPLKIVIKGIHPSTNRDDLASNLQQQLGRAARVKFVYPLKSRIPDRAINIFVAILEKVNWEEKEQIFNIRSLLDLSVRIQAFKEKRQTKMCWNCNSFGHHSELCTFSPRCMRCAKNHKSFECPKTDAVLCCNCGQAHMANFSKCPANPAMRKKQQRSRSSSKNNKRDPSKDKKSPELPKTTDEEFPELPKTRKNPSNLSKSSGAWASKPNIRTPKKAGPIEGTADLQDLFAVINEIVAICAIQSISEIVATLKSSLKSYYEANTPQEKIVAVLEAAEKLFATSTKATP